jgi:hypothetical protein
MRYQNDEHLPHLRVHSHDKSVFEMMQNLYFSEISDMPLLQRMEQLKKVEKENEERTISWRMEKEKV